MVKRMSATDHSFFVNKAAQPDDISRDKYDFVNAGSPNDISC